MRAAQSLYENGYITYMRTDSVTLSQEAITAARNAVSYHFGDKFLSAEPKQYATKTAGEITYLPCRALSLRML